jgi:hypothetical protein
MRRIRNKQHPVGGMWTYVQPETGVKIQDWNWNGFVKRVRDHREACNIPFPASWVDQLEQDVLAANPKIPYDEDDTARRRFTGSDVKRFMATMNELRKGSELVSEAEHRRRLDICAVCPQKGQISCGGCGWLAKQITELMGGCKVPRAEDVYRKSCLACGCDLASKASIPLDVLKRVDEKLGITPDYETGCWMREG